MVVKTLAYCTNELYKYSEVLIAVEVTSTRRFDSFMNEVSKMYAGMTAPRTVDDQSFQLDTMTTMETLLR